MTLEGGSAVRLVETIAYQEGSVVSRQIVKNPSGSVTLFSFDEGEGLSEHTTPHDALVLVLDGRALITVSGETRSVETGEAIVLPGGEPHALSAPERFKMILVMLKRGEERR